MCNVIRQVTRYSGQDVNYPEPECECVACKTVFCFHGLIEIYAGFRLDANGAYASGVFQLLSSGLGIPNGKCVRRTLAANSIVGQDVIRRGQHVRAREDQRFSKTIVEFDR